MEKFFQKKQEGEVEVPEGFMRGDGHSFQVFFKVTVEEITVIRKPELDDIYVHITTGKELASYDYSYKLEDEEKKNYVKTKKASGDFTEESHTKKLLEQTRDNLDVSDLALYINRGGNN